MRGSQLLTANLYPLENHLRCVGVIQNYKYKILRRPGYRVYPIIPGGGTPIMILRQYVYVASINALFCVVHSK